ncbi:phosphate ABC transporter substrate-binding protein [Paenibacillus swuensis]|uniref:Phosphate ABC transporter substrate-binding protein n=1 Tax=Paenibacillus swuensis TaxID=1178515 RepID=A0A172TNQ9_9BACL|nr:phosphate ABC transporter substrate-binding protein [Paenibacillus swuensis]ANE48534.1 phosphate ABC transporter substrate-binding protein [Paenibacillus swuensis]
MKLFNKFTAIVLASALVISAGATLTSAASSLSGKITVNGSSALLPMTLQAAKEFKKKNPRVRIAASGSGSITGPQSVKKGIADIGAVDWDASTSVPGFPAFSGQVATPVAVIPFAAIVNKNVSVDNLTSDQLKGIYTGKIKNWKEVGGADAAIVVVTRSFGSGTRVNFELKALGGTRIDEKASGSIAASNSGTMATTVGSKPNSIGYVDLPYIKGDIKALKFEGVEATTANIVNGKYKIWGTGYYMTAGQPTGATKAFIDYVTSKEFQQGSLKKLKFIPLASIKK